MIFANNEDYRKKMRGPAPRSLYDYITDGSYQENTSTQISRNCRPPCCGRVSWRTSRI